MWVCCFSIMHYPFPNGKMRIELRAQQTDECPNSVPDPNNSKNNQFCDLFV